MSTTLSCYVSDKTIALVEEKRAEMGLSKNQFLKFVLLVAVDDEFLEWLENDEEVNALDADDEEGMHALLEAKLRGK